MKKYFLITFLSMVSVFAQATTWEQEGWKFQKEWTVVGSDPEMKFQLPEFSVVLLKESGWPASDAEKLVQEATQVWKQCSLRFSKIHFYEVQPPNGKTSWDRFPDGANSIVELRKKTPLKNHLIVYFIKAFSDDLEGSGLSTAPWINTEDRRDELNNTIFITGVANTEKYYEERVDSPYNILAHEMLHVLTRFGSHYNSMPPNLSNIWRNRTNLILPKFCEAIESSELVQPISSQP